MNTFKSLCAAGALVCLSGSAEAQVIESVTMTSDPSDVVFTVRADKALANPSVRSYEGQIRVRFADTDAPQTIQVNGDGAAIKLVDVRGGSHDSAVMRLDLGDASKLAAEDVRIENRKHIVVLRIARDLLPPLREPRSEAPAKTVAVEKPAAAAAVVLPSAPGVAPSPKKEVAPPPALATSKTSALFTSKAQAQGPGAAPGKGAPLNKVMAGSGASSPMPMLLGISALLALAYVVLRLVMHKKKGVEKTREPIDIVAERRVGPRHQLVIVRAFGREHLLSIQGGNTTLIAANEEIDVTFSDKLAQLSREESLIEPQAQMIQNVAISHKSEPTREKRAEPSLGGDAIRSAIAQRLSGGARKKASEAEASTGPRSSEEKALSQAVAGLVRLRREAQL